MEDIPIDAPTHCPGTQSQDAGKSSACAGCPNQQICSSGAANTQNFDADDVRKSLSNVKQKIIVLSGKGGVGKSTLSAMIARALSLDPTKEIGILDVDICGPSQPRLFGSSNEQVHSSGSGWSPVYVSENLSLMSIGFLLNDPKDAVIWRGPKKNGMIKQFLKDVDWGNLDFLVIDTPPGTSDEHLSLVQLLSSSPNTAALIVTTPQEVALLDVRKEITFCRKVKLPIIGLVENMSSYICPKCKFKSNIFPPTTGGAKNLSQEFNIPLLGNLPLNSDIGKSCDEGSNLFFEDLNNPISKQFIQIVESINHFFNSSSG